MAPISQLELELHVERRGTTGTSLYLPGVVISVFGLEQVAFHS